MEREKTPQKRLTTGKSIFFFFFAFVHILSQFHEEAQGIQLTKEKVSQKNFLITLSTSFYKAIVDNTT